MKKLAVMLMSVALVLAGAIFVNGQKAETNEDGMRFGKQGHRAGQGKHGNHGKRRGHSMKMLFRELELTDVQKEQIKSIAQASRESSKSLREQVKANREQLRKIGEGGVFSETQVQAIAEQQGALHAQMIVERERVKSQIFAILTPEQKAKAAELKARFEQKMQERKSKMAERKAEKDAQ